MDKLSYRTPHIPEAREPGQHALVFGVSALCPAIIATLIGLSGFWTPLRLVILLVPPLSIIALVVGIRGATHTRFRARSLVGLFLTAIAWTLFVSDFLSLAQEIQGYR